MRKPVVVTQEMAEAMCVLYDAGQTQEQIAERYGCAKSTVARACRKIRAGVPIERPPGVPQCTRSEAAEVELAHLTHVLTVAPRGFGWWPETIMERVYRLETAPPKRNTFGRAA